MIQNHVVVSGLDITYTLNHISILVQAILSGDMIFQIYAKLQMPLHDRLE